MHSPINTPDIFVGRTREIKIATDLARGLLDEAWLLNIWGKGGLGKTQLLTRIQREWAGLGLRTTPILDLQETENQQQLSLMKNIRSYFENTFFSKFDLAVDDFHRADTGEKQLYLAKAQAILIECLRKLSGIHKTCFFIDTFEAIEKTDLDTWLMEEFLPQLGPSCPIVIAGRNRVSGASVPWIIELELREFSLTESKQLIARRYSQRNAILDLTPEQLERAHNLGGGRPILLSLAADWLLEEARVEELLVEEKGFQRNLVSWIRNLSSLENRAILYMVVADKQVDSDILSYLLSISLTEGEGVLKALARFSFVKYRPSSNKCQLHDEMAEMISRFVALPAETNREIASRMVGYYDAKIIDAADETIKRNLAIERLYYLLKKNLEEGVEVFVMDARNALDSGRIDYCSAILNQVDIVADSNISIDLVEIVRAELSVELYKASIAQLILEPLIKRFRENRQYDKLIPSLMILGKAHRMKGEMYQALEAFEESIRYCEEENYSSQFASVVYELSETYFQMGLYSKAESRLEEIARNKEQDRSLNASIFESLANVYRRKGKYDDALRIAKESLQIHKEIGNRRGIGRNIELLALIYRELKLWLEAEEHFRIAAKILEEERDYLGLSRTYSDWAWFEFTRRDIQGTEKLQALEEGKRKAERAIVLDKQYLFQGELAGDLHGMFHLVREQNPNKWDWEGARPYIEEVHRSAQECCDGFMYADAVFHLVEYARRDKDHIRIAQLLQQMEDWESRGFDITFFKARAMYEWGHSYYDQGEFDLAFTKYAFALVLHAGKAGGGAGGIFPFESGVEAIQKQLTNLPHSEDTYARLQQILEHWQLVKADISFPLQYASLIALESD